MILFEFAPCFSSVYPYVNGARMYFDRTTVVP
jgi:hypothetical protein